VVASDGINEANLKNFNSRDHQIDSFGIGTNLVTCQAQPALGCVYKLVEIGHKPVIKLSDDLAKVCKTYVPDQSY
jgi:nicotinate phosphoribosyltransferase